MRALANKPRGEAFCPSLRRRVKGLARIYLVGGASTIPHGWRDTSIDSDRMTLPEPYGHFESIQALQDSLPINVALASPDQCIPEWPGWQAPSPFSICHGRLGFHHYVIYSQSLVKIERVRSARPLRQPCHPPLGIHRPPPSSSLFQNHPPLADSTHLHPPQVLRKGLPPHSGARCSISAQTSAATRRPSHRHPPKHQNASIRGTDPTFAHSLHRNFPPSAPPSKTLGKNVSPFRDSAR